MDIVELYSLNDKQTADLSYLMIQLSGNTAVSSERLKEAAKSQWTHLFAATDDSGRIVGCASLCVFSSPTGKKASVEDVVVDFSFRGHHIGRALMEHIIAYAKAELAPIDIHLTSRPSRIVANELYQSLGFTQKETNVYEMII